MKINIAVMAGGQSRRFDGDKTLELFDGKPLIKHPVDELRKIADDIVIVAKDCSKYEFAGVECIADDYEQQCPMVGILTALKHFKTPVFAVAADVPFPNIEHVIKLMKALGDNDCVMPDIDNKVHPLYACYNTSIVPHLDEAVEKGDYSLMKTVKKLDVVYLDEDSLFSSENEKKSFININTREDYDFAKKYTGDSNG